MSVVQYPLLKACQFGSGQLEEMWFLGATPTNLSLQTPPSPPTGRALGNYCLQLSLSSAQVAALSSQAVQSNSNNGYCFGYWWYPKTNPSSGNVVLPWMDDGALNGVSLYWQSSDKKLAAYDALGTTQKWLSSEAPDAASPAWYFIAWAKPLGGLPSIYIYKHNGGTAGTVADWNLQDSIQLSNVGLFGQGIYMRVTSFANATGAWYAANFYWQDGIGSGPIMPIGKDMVSSSPTGKSLDNTNIRKGDLSGTDSGTSTTVTSTTLADTSKNWTANQWTGFTVTTGGKTGYITSNTGGLGTSVLTVASWVGGTPATGSYTIAVNDPRTGTGESEYPYINEVPATDTSASYLRSFSLLPTLQTYTFTTGLVTGKNVLGVSVSERVRATSTSNIMQVGLDSGHLSASKTFPVTNTWIHDENFASSYSSGSTPYTPTDIDAMTIAHRNTGNTIDVSQLGITIAYGTDDTPTGTPPSLAVASELLLQGVG